MSITETFPDFYAKIWNHTTVESLQDDIKSVNPATWKYTAEVGIGGSHPLGEFYTVLVTEENVVVIADDDQTSVYRWPPNDVVEEGDCYSAAMFAAIRFARTVRHQMA